MLKKLRLKENIMLDALYYPYADIAHSDKLLIYALYFDHIFVLEPNFFQYPTPGNSEIIPSSASMRPLISAGVIKPLGPELLGFNKYYQQGPPLLNDDNIGIINSSIITDLNDDCLTELMRDSGMSAWEIPNGQQLFWNGIGVLLELYNERKISDLTIHTDRDTYYQNLLKWHNYGDVPVKQYIESRVRTNYSELEVKVPALTAESLMITITLLACSEFGLVPITDGKLHHEYLSRKVQNNQTMKNVREVMRTLEPMVNETSLVMKTLNISLPNIGNITAEKVIEIRSACRVSLDHFRVYMQKLRHTIQYSPWSPDVEMELTKIIDTEITPAIFELKNKLQSNKKELGLQIAGDFAKISPLPLLATIATGCPIGIVLAASAGIVALKDYAEYLHKRGELQKNGLFYLLDLASSVTD